MFTSGILLAAGSGIRMGADKLLLPYKGQRLIDRALAALQDCRLIDEVIVVVRPDFPPLPNHPKCRVVVNPGHQEGLGSSLRIGVGAASAAADAFVVSLADMPEITAELVTELIEAFHRSGQQILVPTYQQRNGHPVVFAGACRDDLLRLTGDQGARQMIRAHPELVEHFETPLRAVALDMDTPADLR
jgi:molybdenum cofactor cytidylyltransferase